MTEEISEETLKEEIEAMEEKLSEETLKEEIEAFLKKADLAKTSTKKVIQALEKKFDVKLRSRKDEIDKIVMDYVNSMDSAEEETAPKRRAKTGGGVTKGKGTGFTRPYKLSPQLAELMGADVMPRHAVVKRIWAIVKEKQLYDPNNKQFAICDDAMFKVIGKQRFRIFGMMKYLKSHFLQDE